MTAPVRGLAEGLAARPSRSWTFWIGLILVGINVIAALLTLVWTPYDPSNTAGGRLEAPSWVHRPATDRGWGATLFTQIMIGSRIALMVGAGAVATGAAIGVTLGVLAAFATKWLDDALAAALDILIAFPTLLLAMLVVAASDTATLWSAILALGLALSAIVARLTRILAKRVLRMDYITAARHGPPWLAIRLIYVLPNIWPTLSVVSLCSSGSLPSPRRHCLTSAWGRRHPMRPDVCCRRPRATASMPRSAMSGSAFLLLVIGINMTADGLRDVVDPTRRGRR